MFSTVDPVNSDINVLPVSESLYEYLISSSNPPFVESNGLSYDVFLFWFLMNWLIL